MLDQRTDTGCCWQVQRWLSVVLVPVVIVVVTEFKLVAVDHDPMMLTGQLPPRRYFVLSSWSLRWFHDKHEYLAGYASLGSILVSAARVSEPDIDARRFVLRVFDASSHREYVMAAPTAIEHRKWLTALSERVEEARVKTEGDPTRVMLQGYMHKRGGGRFSSEWKRRYFVLAKGSLRYFRDRQTYLSRRPEQGSVELGKRSEVRPLANESFDLGE